MKAKYRITRSITHRSSDWGYTLEQRKYHFGLFPYWDYIAQGTDEEMHKILDDIVIGEYDPLNFDVEGCLL